MSNPTTTKEKKTRVFDLAKELGVASKDLVGLAQELGYATITNQLNGLEPGQVEALKERVKKGAPKAAAPAGPRAPAAPKVATLPPPGSLTQKVTTLPPAKPKPAPKPPEPTAPTPTQPAVEPIPAPAAEVVPPPASEPLSEATPQSVAETKPAAPVPPPNIIPTGGGVRNLSGGVRNLNAGQRPAGPPVKPVKPAAPAVPPPPAPKPAEPAAPAASAPVEPPKPAAPQPAAPPAPAQPPPNVIPPRPTMGGGGVPTLGGNPQQRPASLDRRPNPPPPRNLGTGPVPPRPGPSSGPGGARPGGPLPGGPRPGPSGPGTSNPTGGPPRPGVPGKPPAPPKAGQPMKLTPEMIQRLRDAQHTGKKVTITDLNKPAPVPGPGGPGRPAGPGGPPRPGFGPPRPMEGGTDGSSGPEDEDGKKKVGPGGVIGRDSRHKGRQNAGRARGPASTDRGSVIIGANGQVETIESQWGSRRGPRAALLRKARRGQQVVTVKEGRIEIPVPITIRSLSETIGMKVGELTKRLLKETNKLYAITSVVEFEVAALIAAEKNIELIAKKVETAEDKLLREFEELVTNVDEAKLLPRPPIVTIMGHVDHGKTSLLDKIRANYGIESDVVSTEAGGITQVIRAWSVKREVEIEKEDGESVIENRYVTFLDTPGHEAFTKMRARGANVTDIAVIVVAATDGVMPQTQEAISHAKAADVKIMVAINKTDMPNANVAKTRQQLYGEGLIPDDMGGDVQFVETSAVTGKGITELLDQIVLVAEIEDLKADPDRAAIGTCLEAYMSADEGVTATVLVQQGTLNRGDIVLCGSTFGRVRAMYNDVGKPTNSAGPSTPVRITGLGAVPNADDPFYVVDELTKAKEIAEAREKKDRDEKLFRFTTVTLDNLSAVKAKAKITELKIILKAEARGSVEAIRKELEKLVHEEVRTRVLHAGIGAITESDVELALTSPEDTLVIGFNVTTDDAAQRLAEARHVSVREYDIIYKLTDDVKSALEGKLKPIEEVVHLGRAVIRQTFKVGKVGTIAGCYVTSGTIERSARVRVIREGVVVFPPSEKVVGLESLKRFKDDAKEVREGFECGMKIAGYDDVKVGDVIEAFKIESRARTL